MKPASPPITPNESMFDSIAKLLPAERREQFYRRMAHLRNLQPDDEMLQIAEAMGYLALLIREAPTEVSRERVQLSEMLEAALGNMQAIERAAAQYHKSVDARLKTLPSEIARGISPEVIASTIRESLRQRFAETGMEDTAETLNVISERMRRSNAELTASLNEFADPMSGALARLDTAVTVMHSDLQAAAQYVRNISAGLYCEVKHSLFLLNAVWCAAGFVVGILVWHWRS